MKQDDQHIGFREQIVKYLAGEMDADSKLIFEEQLALDMEKNSLFAEYSKIWDGVDRLAAKNKYNLDSEWDSLSSKITFEKKVVKTRSLKINFIRIAAAVVIGLSSLAVLYLVKNNLAWEQVALEQGSEIIHLKDGSTVALNGGSSIKYMVDGKSGVRKVMLSGEAFFEVARDTLRPFIIEAGSTVIEVLGTSFNVSAYEDQPTVEVTVNSGLVSMATKKRNEKQIILNPGNAGVYNKTAEKLVLVAKSDPNAFAWKTRELVFSETPLAEVVKAVNHVYNTNLKIGSDAISNCEITVSFSQQEFSAVLNVLVSTLDLILERKNGEIILTGERCD